MQTSHRGRPFERTRLWSVPALPGLLRRQLWALTPLACLAAMVAWVGADAVAARLINDDPAYYVLVGKNLFTHGPTYDGLYPTNGVHPLFALLLGGIFRVFSVSFEQLASVSVLTCACLGCALSGVLLETRAMTRATRVGVVAVLSSMAVYPILYRGMEGALALLVMVCYLRALDTARASFWIPCALSIASWGARLELIAFPPVAILIGGRALGFDRPSTQRWFAAWGVSVLAFAAYAAASFHWIGLALPVSGLIKQSSVQPLPTFIALGSICALATAAGLFVPALQGVARRAHRTHALLAWAGVFYLGHAWGQPDTERQTWYYFVLPGLLACALIELELEVGPRLRRAIAASLAGGALVATLWEGAWVIPLRAEWRRGIAAVAAEAKRTAQPGERFMGPGWMSLLVGPQFQPFSQDGLVGGVEQYHALREGRLLEFAYASGVRYLFVSRPDAQSGVPELSTRWQLELVSDAVVPSGRSVWAALDGAGDGGGFDRSGAHVSVYRLSERHVAER
jgi:hypothetical protein